MSANDDGLGAVISDGVSMANFDIYSQPDCEGERQDFKNCQAQLPWVLASKAQEAFTGNAIILHYVLLCMRVSHSCASRPVIVQKLTLKRASVYTLL